MRILLFCLLLLTAVPTYAQSQRICVPDVAVIGSSNKDEMRQMVQTLLLSRLNSAAVVAVQSCAENDLRAEVSYISVGTTFSLDAQIKGIAGKESASAFIQGTTADELIAAVGKLAAKISAEVAKAYGAQAVGAVGESGSSSGQQLQKVLEGDIIKTGVAVKEGGSSWTSSRLDGAATLMAIGSTLPGGEREIFLAEDHRVSSYRQGKEIKFVADVELKSSEKIISLDVITGSNQENDIYVTIIRSSEVASQIWQIHDGKFVRIAENIPYYFRVANLAGGPKKLYAQSMGRDDDYYGDVAEATRNGATIVLKNPLKMPRYGNIYSFNQFRDLDGKLLTVVIHPDGYLIVYDQAQKELWRSNDKFGGSELYFQKENDANLRLYGEKYRWIFMNQYIQVSTDNEILVGKNDGAWMMGNARSYKKGAVYSFIWNGAGFEEKWRTRETQNYMPAYYCDEKAGELLQLQMVQRDGIFSRGVSVITVKKIR